MADIRNENPPLAEENLQETLMRLEKTKSKVERSSTIIKGIGVALPIVAGLAWLGITGNGGMIELSALAAFPVVTAVVAAHALVRDAMEHKIDAMKKKISGSFLISSLLKKQKSRLKSEEQRYNQLKLQVKQDSRLETAEATENAQKFVEKEKRKEAVFSKAAELAKQEGKEKTVGRLMSIVDNYKDGNTFKYVVGGALQGIYSLFVTPGAIEMISQRSHDPLTLAFAAATAITIPATVYCAAKTVQSIKRERKADKAFKSLEKYTSERS